MGQSYFELSKQNIEKTRSKIHERITHLYGPIVGNRLLHKAAIQVCFSWPGLGLIRPQFTCRTSYVEFTLLNYHFRQWKLSILNHYDWQ